MIMYQPMDIVVAPDTTFMMITYMNEVRRVHTDGRQWPKDEIEPSFTGYSIGEWIDENKDGRFNVLAVETRGLAGPRTFDASGLPLHQDNETVVKERIYLDKNDANLLHDEVTVIDHALTCPLDGDPELSPPAQSGMDRVRLYRHSAGPRRRNLSNRRRRLPKRRRGPDSRPGHDLFKGRM
jgi:hypothetical protein